MRRIDLPGPCQIVGAALDDAAGEMTPTVVARLQQIDLGNRVVTDGLIDLIFEAEQEEAAYREEARRCTAFARQAQRRHEGLRAHILGALLSLGRVSLDGPRHSCCVANNSAPSIEWAGKGEIPVEFQRIKIELDKAKAKVAEEAQALPLGFRVVYGKHLLIT